MNKFLTLRSTTALVLVLAAFLITGCSSGGGGSNNDADDSGTATVPDGDADDGSGGTATVPANAVVIDSSNAVEIVTSAASIVDAFEEAQSTFAVQVTPAMGLKSALDIVTPLIKNRSNNTGIDLATGVVINESYDCSDGGTFSFTGNETDDGINIDESGTATFNNCNEFNFSINGSISFSYTENIPTGVYSDDVTGSLSMVLPGQEAVSLNMTGINFKETGDNFNKIFTTSSLSFTIDFVTNGSSGGGFTVELLAPIVESNGDDCPESGRMLITGGNNTTAEGIFSDGSSITINANGTFVTSISCT